MNTVDLLLFSFFQVENSLAENDLKSRTNADFHTAAAGDGAKSAYHQVKLMTMFHLYTVGCGDPLLFSQRIGLIHNFGVKFLDFWLQLNFVSPPSPPTATHTLFCANHMSRITWVSSSRLAVL
jgi:hypothetical protein